MRYPILVQTLIVATILLVGAARAATVTGETPRLAGFFANYRECMAAQKDGVSKADRLCRQQRHRGADRTTVRFGGCLYGDWGTKRTVKVTFRCE